MSQRNEIEDGRSASYQFLGQVLCVLVGTRRRHGAGDKGRMFEASKNLPLKKTHRIQEELRGQYNLGFTLLILTASSAAASNFVLRAPAAIPNTNALSPQSHQVRRDRREHPEA
jgi:hypothetical protein